MVTKDMQSYERMMNLKNPNEVNLANTENFQTDNDNEHDTNLINDILGNPFDETAKTSPTQSLLTTVTTKRGKKVVMPRSWTMDRYVSKLLAFLEHSKLASLGLTGISGSGKTVACKTILHHLHQQDPSYVIKWFSRHDVLNMEKVLDSMPRNRNIVIIMDDISWLTNLYTKQEKSETGNLLATMRHSKFGENSKILLINLNHYSYSSEKGLAFRATSFQLNIGISANEIMNLKEVYGKYSIKNYSRIWRQAVLNGGFQYQLDGYADKSVFYDMKDFRPVLCNEVNWGHLLMVEEVSCNICNKDKWNTEEESPISEEAFIDMLKYPKAQLRSAFRFFSFLRTGDIMFLNPSQRKLYRHISKAYEHCDFDLKKIVGLLEGDMKYHRAQRKNETKDDKHVTKVIDKVIEKSEKKKENDENWLKDYTKVQLPENKDFKYGEEK